MNLLMIPVVVVDHGKSVKTLVNSSARFLYYNLHCIVVNSNYL